MNIFIIVLRLIHIVSGVFWVGSALVNAFFLSPAIAANPDAGGKIMGYLVTKGHFAVRIAVAGILTVLAGGTLYWIDSQGLTSAWTSSPTGWGFGIGGLFALVGLGFGMLVGVNVTKMTRIGAAAQGKPTPEQLTQLQAAQKQLAMVSNVSTVALILALVCMATARYWGLL